MDKDSLYINSNMCIYKYKNVDIDSNMWIYMIVICGYILYMYVLCGNG